MRDIQCGTSQNTLKFIKKIYYQGHWKTTYDQLYCDYMAHRSHCEVWDLTAVWIKIQVLSDAEFWCLRNVGNQ